MPKISRKDYYEYHESKEELMADDRDYEVVRCKYCQEKINEDNCSEREEVCNYCIQDAKEDEDAHNKKQQNSVPGTQGKPGSDALPGNSGNQV